METETNTLAEAVKPRKINPILITILVAVIALGLGGGGTYYYLQQKASKASLADANAIKNIQTKTTTNTPTSTSTTTKSSTNTSSTPATNASNIFTLTSKVGDVFAGMTLNEIIPFTTELRKYNPGNTISDRPIAVDNIYAAFTGRAIISGEYNYVGPNDPGLVSDYVSFTVTDPNSLAKLPQLSGDPRTGGPESIWFGFSNQELAKQFLGLSDTGKKGQVTIEIDNYKVESYPSEVMNMATIISVK